MLYLVPTPIGNLRDITLRALDLLQEADLILCEDTRRTRRLLEAYKIVRPLLSLHEHNEGKRVGEVMGYLETGQKVALVSDAGMPLISDPGYKLVQEAVRRGVRVEALPGASSLLSALTASALAVDRFSFFGFLPAKKAARAKGLEALKEREETLLFFETPYRILEALEDMLRIFGDREAALARELTKKFEEILRGRLSELIGRVRARKPLGEMVVVVAGKGRKEAFHP